MPSEPKLVKIYNGQVITPRGVLPNGCVLIKDGIILGIEEREVETPGAILVDALGDFIAPGFIDIHVHGGGGHDFMDNSVEAFLAIADTHARFGTTAMFPTTLTSSHQEIIETIRTYERSLSMNCRGAQFMGLHLEGPYLAMSQRGAQDPQWIRNPDAEEYSQILSSTSEIKRWSAAPELPGAITFGKYLRERGVLVSLAHTDAVYEEILDAFQNGFTLATHLYSAMSGVTRRNGYRYAGAIESAFIIDAMDVEIIADGIHVPPPLLKLVYKIKGPFRIALITDAMRAASMPPGKSVIGNWRTGLPVIVEDGVSKLPDKSAFAGSVATADRLVRTMVHQAGIEIPEAVQMITQTPARIMNIADRKGSLVKGKDADIVLFDQGISVKATMIKGEIVYQQNNQF